MKKGAANLRRPCLPLRGGTRCPRRTAMMIPLLPRRGMLEIDYGGVSILLVHQQKKMQSAVSAASSNLLALGAERGGAVLFQLQLLLAERERRTSSSSKCSCTCRFS